jgi:hypothetical protein
MEMFQANEAYQGYNEKDEDVQLIHTQHGTPVTLRNISRSFKRIIDNLVKT